MSAKLSRAGVIFQVLKKREKEGKETTQIDFLGDGGFVFHNSSGEVTYDAYGNWDGCMIHRPDDS